MNNFIQLPFIFKIKISLFLLILLVGTTSTYAQTDFEFSKAGYFSLENSGRQVFNFNSGWRYHKGKVKDGQLLGIDDHEWEIINCPHGLELNSDQASGGVNYQGEAWYRKHFTLPFNKSDRRITLHFESVMGKSKVWLNNKLVGEHFGGYLPFEIDLTPHLKNGENIISVMADNSNDPSYPPGKPQERMDFAYFGGIYRDVWLVSTNKTYITNPNGVNKIAGGGVFVHYENLSKKSVDVVVKSHIKSNDFKKNKTLLTLLKNAKGQVVGQQETELKLSKSKDNYTTQKISIKNPILWTLDKPELYSLELRIQQGKKIIDGVKLKQGIRKIEFKGRDGFFLNNKAYQGKLTGVNRHQDQAYVGNALPNNATFRDALILKNAGCKIIRAAHYPADPAFMDACDALGMFFIVATPGWHFWSEQPIFEERVISDIRNMVRRDRNHASVIMWEPILNEAQYPASFAKNACATVHQEFPYQGAYTASDNHARGGEYSDVAYSHQFEGDWWSKAVAPTKENYEKYAFDYSKDNRTYFVREWGDAVDNWSAHNSPSRAARAWGEQSQLLQAKHYEHMDMVNTDWETIYQLKKQHVGATLWCGFDHQRGYNPDPFYGGLTDVFRQSKYSYHLFASQKNPDIYKPNIHIAHEMTPFSSPDITIFTNCEEVRLVRYEKDTFHIKIKDLNRSLPHPSVVFKNIFRFMDLKEIHGNPKLKHKANIVVQGLIDGKIVATDKRILVQKATNITLQRLSPNTPFNANGSDFVTVIASLTDNEGYPKRQNNNHIKFEVEGEGEIIDNGKIFANPRLIEWGTAPVLIRATNKPGKITIKAYLAEEGINKASLSTLTLETKASTTPTIYTEERKHKKKFIKKENSNKTTNTFELAKKVKQLEKELNELKLKEVEKQQTDFIKGGF